MTRPAPQLNGTRVERDATWRRRYYFLIDRAARTIPVGFAAIETATLYAHKYFSARSMALDDPLVIATAALYLACKVEEQPKSVVTVAEAVFSVAYKHKRKALELLRVREFSAKLKEKILTAERALLYVTAFDFAVEHPTQLAIDFLQSNYNLLLPEDLKVSQELWLEECACQSGPSYDVMNQLSLVAWNFCLVSYQSPLILRFSASLVAAAAIFAALQMLGMSPALRSGWHWFELQPFKATPSLLKDVVSELLSLCKHRRTGQHAQPGPMAVCVAASQQAMTMSSSDPQLDRSEEMMHSTTATMHDMPTSAVPTDTSVLEPGAAGAESLDV